MEYFDKTLVRTSAIEDLRSKPSKKQIQPSLSGSTTKDLGLGEEAVGHQISVDLQL